jgi:hypothetical protein
VYIQHESLEPCQYTNLLEQNFFLKVMTFRVYFANYFVLCTCVYPDNIIPPFSTSSLTSPWFIRWLWKGRTLSHHHCLRSRLCLQLAWKEMYLFIYMFCCRTDCGGKLAVKEGIAALVLMPIGILTSTGWVNKRKKLCKGQNITRIQILTDSIQYSNCLFVSLVQL